MIKPIDRYTDAVLSGKIKTGKYIKLAVERNLKNFEDSRYKDYPFYFDEKKANHILEFVPICHHWKGAKAGKPIEFEDHQAFYFANLFGWKRKEDHTRRFRRSFKEVARKNAKTTEEAIKAIYHIALDGETGAQVYCGATKEDQARLVVTDAGKIIETSPYLNGNFRLFKHNDMIKRVVYETTSSFIAPIGRDSKTQDGFDPSMGIMDEYHAHKTADLLNVILTGMGARSQPLMDIITTAGFDKQLPCFDLRKVCIDILEGKLQDENLFALIYELDEDDDWQDEDVWIKANPNLGSSVNLSYLREQVLRAKNEGGRTEVEVKTKNFNIWTDAPSVWIPDDIWKLGDAKPETNGKRWYGGLDMGATSDFTCFMLMSEPDSMGVHDMLFWFWIPDDRLREREKKDKIPYTKWVGEGFISTTPGNVVDDEYIYNDLVRIYGEYDVISTGYDPWNATKLAARLTENVGCEMFIVSQTISTQSEPTKNFEKLALGAKFRHGGNPVMRWMMGNVVIIKDNNDNYKISKSKSNEKVDGPTASVNAYATFMSSEEQTFGIW